MKVLKCLGIQPKKGSFFLQPRAHANFGFFNNGVTIPKAQFRVVVQIEGIYKHVENCKVHRESVFRYVNGTFLFFNYEKNLTYEFLIQVEQA